VAIAEFVTQAPSERLREAVPPSAEEGRSPDPTFDTQAQQPRLALALPLAIFLWIAAHRPGIAGHDASDGSAKWVSQSGSLRPSWP
jgi:hypothetical protein